MLLLVFLKIVKFIQHLSLTSKGIVTPYDDIDLGPHRLRSWFLADGTKPEPMATSYLWASVAFTWEQFRNNWPSYYSV